MADVRFGSKADMCSALGDVRFTPESGHESRRALCLLCQKRTSDRYSITSSSRSDPGNKVGLVRERFCAPRLRFKNLDELNACVLDQCITYAKAAPPFAQFFLSSRSACGFQ
jgi:hypothetical protein